MTAPTKGRKATLPAFVRLVRDHQAWDERVGREVKVGGPEDALRVLGFLRDEEVEVFVVVMLNTRGKVLGATEVSRGLMDASLVHPRECFRAAIAMGAASIIIAHNHPSGDPTPSQEDRQVTRQLVNAGTLLDLPVRDHIIVAGNRWMSFAQAGMM